MDITKRQPEKRGEEPVCHPTSENLHTQKWKSIKPSRQLITRNVIFSMRKKRGRHAGRQEKRGGSG